MRYGSLFSGIGGLDLGLDRAGMSCAFQVEIDPYCRKVLARHWPDVPRYEDVKDVGSGLSATGGANDSRLIRQPRKQNDGTTVASGAGGRSALPPVDLICGGFPCQDLSVAGRRAGLAGERSGLWHEFHRVLAELRPRWCLIENVPGLLSSNDGRDFAVLLRGLAELGYLCEWRILDSQHFGVPQRRRRVFIIGCLGEGSGLPVLLEPESVFGDSAPSRATGEGVAAALTHGVDSQGRGGYAGRRREDDVNIALGTFQNTGHGWWNESPTAQTVRTGSMEANVVTGAISSKWAKGTGGPAGDECYNLVSHTLSSEGSDASEDGTGRGTPIVVPFDTTQITSKGNYSKPKSGDPCHPLAARAHPPAVAFNVDRRRSPTTDPVANALHSSESGTMFSGVVAAVPRRLTPRECERLQGFPDDWTRYAADGSEIADSPRYRMLGNAVTVPVAHWIGERLAGMR